MCLNLVVFQIVKVFYAKVHLSRDGIETQHREGKLYYLNNDTTASTSNDTTVVVVPLSANATNNATKLNTNGKYTV